MDNVCNYFYNKTHAFLKTILSLLTNHSHQYNNLHFLLKDSCYLFSFGTSTMYLFWVASNTETSFFCFSSDEAFFSHDADFPHSGQLIFPPSITASTCALQKGHV